MSARILDGKALAATMQTELAAEVAAFRAKTGIRPCLAAVLVGDNQASRLYVRNKEKACEKAGIARQLHELPGDISQAALLEIVQRLNADAQVHGILVQLPLPKHIDEAAITDAVAAAKDVDGFNATSLGLLTAGRPNFLACTPYGVMQILQRNNIPVSGKHVVVAGRSNIVGKPLALMLMQKPSAANPAACDATVTVAHTRTHDLAHVCRRADILVAAVGKAGVITPDMVKPGAAVVDVGTNSVNGKLTGDVHPGVADVAGWLSPVPGGVGPMTITMLLYNTLAASEQIDG